MAWTVEIYNPSNAQTYDVTARTLEITSDEKLGAESNTFKVSCKLIQEVHKFHTINVKKDGVARFAGFIINQSDQDKGMKVTEFTCLDWTYILSNRTVAETYQSTDSFMGRPDLIIKNMIGKAASELTTTNVDVCDVTSIEFLQFPYIQLMEAVAKVMDYIPGWFWYVDALKDFHLFRGYEVDGITFGPDQDGQYNFDIYSLKVDYIGEQQVNRLWIVGAKQAQPNYIDQYFTADGQQRYFSLSYEPNFTEIYIDEVLKNSKLESNDDGVQDFLINKQQKVIFIPDNITTPFTGKIRVHYRPTKQVIDYYENAPNIATYGLYEKVVKNRDITDKLSARQYGKAEIKRKSTEKRIVNLSTREDAKIGQRCYLNIVVNDPVKGNWNVVGYFLVTAIRTNITVVDEVRTVSLEEII
jgi:hypothetical protein